MSEGGLPDPVTAAVPTRLRDRFDPRPGLARMRASSMPILQLTIAVTAAISIARYGLGHAAPLLAATVTISSLGLARDTRPSAVARTLGGMLVGILIAEAVLLAFGQGWWQAAVTTLVVLFVARFLSPALSFATVAAVQGLIVMVLPTTISTPVSRLLDALIAGAVALAVTVLVPRTLTHETAREARSVFAALDDAMRAVAQGLHRGDPRRADRALEKARGIDAHVTAWRGVLESSASVARISPWLARRRTEVERQQRMLRATDYAVRNLRVVARRASYTLADRAPRPVVADLVTALARAATLVGRSIDDPAREPEAREAALAIARALDPGAIHPSGPLKELNLIAALRPLAVDIAVAAGVDSAEARGALPPL